MSIYFFTFHGDIIPRVCLLGFDIQIFVFRLVFLSQHHHQQQQQEEEDEDEEEEEEEEEEEQEEEEEEEEEEEKKKKKKKKKDKKHKKHKPHKTCLMFQFGRAMFHQHLGLLWAPGPDLTNPME